MTLLGIIIGWLLFAHREEPKCPPFHSEVKKVYAKYDSVEWREWSKKQETFTYGRYTYISATTTGGDNWEIGTTTDQEAVEYNKIVEQCRIANGEF